MLDELVVEHDGKRYVGHIWPARREPPLARHPTHYWRFAYLGHLVAEFPATVLDTPTDVKTRLLGALARRPTDH